LSDTDLAAAATVASGKDVALVFITADSGEGGGLVEGMYLLNNTQRLFE
jgi:beta-glucosidase